MIDHVPADILHKEKCAVNIGIHHPLQVLSGQVAQVGIVPGCGRIDEDIHRTEGIHGEIHQLGHLLLFPDIAEAELHRISEAILLQKVHCSLFLNSGIGSNHNLCPALEQPIGNIEAQSGAAAGYQRNLSLYGEHLLQRPCHLNVALQHCFVIWLKCHF